MSWPVEEQNSDVVGEDYDYLDIYDYHYDDHRQQDCQNQKEEFKNRGEL